VKTLGNILWLVLGGVWLALAWLMWAGILALTIVGIPFGLQCIKLAEFSLWPFGRQAVADPSASKLGAIGAVLWFIPGPLIPLLDTTLLTNAPGEPRVGSQVLAEIASADRIDIVMAFIRRSGIRLCSRRCGAHCERGGRCGC
jgi:hypothetical protein